MEGQKWYYDYEQGHGKILPLPVEIKCYDGIDRKVYSIGTSGCYTCVGIYVRLSDSECFMAHLAADLLDGEGDEVYQPNEGQGKRLRQALLGKLQAVPELTALVNAKDYQPRQGEIVVCSMLPDAVGGKTSAGKYLIDGLQEFFGNQTQAKWGTGFVMDHTARQTHWIDRKWKEEMGKDVVEAPEDADFEDTDEATPRDYRWFHQTEEVDDLRGRFEWHFVWKKGKWMTDVTEM
ncbi:hypothetical protein DOTSEDRAFT_28463 [Dothistroma septosporum NZE10]|uniref:Uncharacterized protein n=1 Tax=Dothistroma septosporum (strain NZE10 / CBS 128990) TaxID=675120 RepID=M2Y1W2_DOTSN|nr:hypothetical protein DOTSEDRAFT_28463 [Dothistroma septosporum NZE10]